MNDDSVKLVDPTDFDVLEVMSDGKRQTAPNLAELTGRKRQYMNDRLSALAGHQLVRSVGPSDRSGMYEITDRGRRALEYRDLYSHSKAVEFGKLVAGELSKDELEG